MKRRIVSVCLVSLISLLAATVALTPTARAMPKAGMFTYHAGDAFLAAINATFAPDNATQADTGDFVLLAGTGTFDTTSKTVTGGGMFTELVLNLTTGAPMLFNSGDWTVAGFVRFDSYGPAGSGFPAGFFGGRLVIRVTLLPESQAVSAVLTITCALGSPPSGAREGVKLNIQDNETFNLSTGGATVFVLM